METDFIYWRHKTPIGVKVEEITGADQRQGAVWRAMAMQVYCENGREGYRSVEHLQIGAPLLYDSFERISITHTDHFLAVATLPPTPETPLGLYSARAALGIDAERADRSQVLGIRSRFLSPDELAMTGLGEDPSVLQRSIVAWTAKEAIYKAALQPGLDLREGIRLHRLPDIDTGTLGEGCFVAADGHEEEMILYAYRSEQIIVTLAISPRSATWSKQS